MSNEYQPAILFMDFDGTITRTDVIDAVLERFADERWLEIERQWREGRIGSRECLRRQVALVKASRDEMDALIDSIQVDEGFALLLEICARHRIATHIVSDGFDYCIRRILERPQLQLAGLLRGVRICSAHLELDGHSSWRASFPFFDEVCADGCGTCKPAVMRLLNRRNGRTIFVGDGLSDKYAALSADMVFAKSSLAAYCRQQGIDYVPFDELDEVAAFLVDAAPFDVAAISSLTEALSA